MNCIFFGLMMICLIHKKAFAFYKHLNLNFVSQDSQPSNNIKYSSRLFSNKDEKKKYSKSNLPVKTCVVCQRPFSWRKKWEKVWDEVKYCSDRCRGQRNAKDIPQKLHSISHINKILPINPHENNRDNFKKFITMSSLFTISSMASINLAANAKTNNNRPTKQEIEELFKDYDWLNEEFREVDFRRLDETSDTLFYDNPRFVEHIDGDASTALTKYHNKLLLQMKGNNKLSVLDVCSSWVSHVSKDVINKLSIQEFIGIGMNEDELKANPSLTQYFVRDLNNQSTLKDIFPEEEVFDVILLQLSIDYMIHPISLCRELCRLLKKRGQLVISFSNRLFIQKAVAIWTGKSDLEHIEIVGKYIHFAHGFDDNIIIEDISPQKSSGDPLYVVRGTKL